MLHSKPTRVATVTAFVYSHFCFTRSMRVFKGFLVYIFFLYLFFSFLLRIP